MKIDPVVRRETLHLAMGLLVVDALACAVFALLRAFDYTVVTGVLFGTVAAVGNFFFLGLTMQKATDKASGQKKAVQLSYSLRMLVLCAAVALGALLPWFHVIAVIVPLVMTTPVILILQAIAKR